MYSGKENNSNLIFTMGKSKIQFNTNNNNNEMKKKILRACNASISNNDYTYLHAV